MSGLTFKLLKAPNRVALTLPYIATVLCREAAREVVGLRWLISFVAEEVGVEFQPLTVAVLARRDGLAPKMVRWSFEHHAVPRDALDPRWHPLKTSACSYRSAPKESCLSGLLRRG